MVKTHGMSHVALAVRDPARSREFYARIFGAVAVYEDADSVQMQTPGTRDVLVFERDSGKAGKRGGIAHFGFRLTDPADIAVALRELRAAGATINDHGEFAPGLPYVFFNDPDGYEVEVWYEAPTSADPPPLTRSATKTRK